MHSITRRNLRIHPLYWLLGQNEKGDKLLAEKVENIKEVVDSEDYKEYVDKKFGVEEEVPVVDEDGNLIVDEGGNIQYETKIVEYTIQEIIERIKDCEDEEIDLWENYNK